VRFVEEDGDGRRREGRHAALAGNRRILVPAGEVLARGGPEPRPGDSPGHEVQPGQPCGEAAAGPLQHVPGGAVLGDPALLQHDHPIGEHVGVQHIVRNDDGPAPGQDPFQQAPQQRRGVDVEGSHRLVQQQQPRVGGQRPGHRHPLGLAPGEFRGPTAGKIRGVDLHQPAPGCFPRLGPWNTGAPGTERDVFERAQVREQQRFLGQQGGAAAVRRGPGALPGPELEEDPSVHLRPAGIGAEQAGHHGEQGGLAGPVRPKHRHGLRFPEGQRDIKAADSDGGVERERHGRSRPAAAGLGAALAAGRPAGEGPR
jgi:hypothetical protein